MAERGQASQTQPSQNSYFEATITAFSRLPLGRCPERELYVYVHICICIWTTLDEKQT